jgi:hypothetical protein
MRPSSWEPHRVINPNDREGRSFSPAGAWEFIADALEAGEELAEITLDKPAGKSAFVMKLRIHATKPRLYIKLELGSGKVIGRSFHQSDYDT